jgi:methylase of polypeptide subunit release factors
LETPTPPTFPLQTESGPVDASWRSESGAPPPSRLRRVDDRLTANEAVRWATAGEFLLWEGDFNNGRQLLLAMERRLRRITPQGPTPLDAFLSEREQRASAHGVLGHLIMALDRRYALPNPRAPDVREACELAFGEATHAFTVVSLRTLMGVMGAAEWRRKGLLVPGLTGRLYPHYGVFSPTRHEYVSLMLAAPPPTGKTVFDIGTGTGILGLVALQRGAKSVVATDVEPRAVACARDNAARLGLAGRMTVAERALFPEGRADLVLCNPPWVPHAPKTRLDRAVFDEGGRFLSAFLLGVGAHLNAGGEGYLFLSNFAELLGLRPKGYLHRAFTEACLRLRWKRATPPLHGKARERADPLHALRQSEVTTLYCLTAA